MREQKKTRPTVAAVERERVEAVGYGALLYYLFYYTTAPVFMQERR